MRTRITTTTVLAGSALAAALALAGCTTGDTGGAGASGSPTGTAGESNTATAGTGPGASASPSAPDASGGTASTAEANRADHMFARMMIPHHEQAIQMSDIILAKEGLDPEVATLAEEIKAAQGPEIEQMESWLKEWGVDGDGMGPGSNGPMGPGPTGSGSRGSGRMGEGGMMGDSGMMGGMLSRQELQEMEQAGTEEATRLFLEGMIGHHEGAIDMAQAEVRNGQYPDAVALARTIIETQRREIVTMRELLGQ